MDELKVESVVNLGTKVTMKKVIGVETNIITNPQKQEA